MLPAFRYIRPTSLREALERVRGAGAVIHAGGTDLLGCLRDRVFPAGELVAIGAIDELRGIRESGDGGLRIGALATLADVAADPLVRERYPVLAQAAASAASPQLRNQGTIGGNLCQRPRCWYFRGDFHCLRKGGGDCFALSGENQYHCIFGGAGCVVVHPSDTAPALVALDARVRLVSAGAARTVALSSFFVPPSEDVRRETVLRPGELLAEVLIPPPGAGHRSAYRKVRARGAWDFALAGVAIVLRGAGRVDHARVVLSGVAPVPWRVPAVEDAILGRSLDADVIGRAAAASIEGARPLARNAYKVPLVRGIVQETLERLAAPA